MRGYVDVGANWLTRVCELPELPTLLGLHRSDALLSGDLIIIYLS